MKHLLIAFLSLGFLSGCAQREDRQREREVTPQLMGGVYTFKTWPGSTTTYSLALQGVKKTSAVLGPDFSVHYFNFDPEASLALYNGSYPQSKGDSVTTRFHAAFGRQRATWNITKQESEFRAEAYVPDGDHSIWHLIINAPTEQRIRDVADQLGSFRQQKQPHRSTAANKERK